jgi:hypothetical protein
MLLSKALRGMPGVCWGTWNGSACPISLTRHRKGAIDGMGLIHFADRRFTRRAAKNLLLLVAARERQRNPEYLNIPIFDWLYIYMDSIRAGQIAMDHGFRLPGHVFDRQRREAMAMAKRRSIAVSKWDGFYQWARA